MFVCVCPSLPVFACDDRVGKDREPSQTNVASSHHQFHINPTPLHQHLSFQTQWEKRISSLCSSRWRQIMFCFHNLKDSLTQSHCSAQSLIRPRVHTHTALWPLLVTSCCIRKPLMDFYYFCLMSARHALLSAHTYRPLRMYSVQLCAYRHQCVHVMHECIKSVFLLLWWACMCSFCALHLSAGMSLRQAEGF